MESATPRSSSRPRARGLTSKASTKTLSVTSRPSILASSPDLLKASSMCPTQPEWRNCLAEKFTITVNGVPRARPCCHPFARRQASSTTHLPMGTIRPISSASATNSEGPRSPRRGCRHRNRAPTPPLPPPPPQGADQAHPLGRGAEPRGAQEPPPWVPPTQQGLHPPHPSAAE